MESKANQIPYFHADYPTAINVSEDMYTGKTFTRDGKTYNYSSVINTGLMTGTQWDVMLKYMTDNTADQIKNTNNVYWGNYQNVELTNVRGKYATVTGTNSADGGDISGWNSIDNSSLHTKSNGNYEILTTGSTNQVQKKHIYDVEGNLWEWTEDASFYSNTYYLLRGGGFCDAYGAYPACYRITPPASNTDTHRGFRVALYIK